MTNAHPFISTSIVYGREEANTDHEAFAAALAGQLEGARVEITEPGRWGFSRVHLPGSMWIAVRPMYGKLGRVELKIYPGIGGDVDAARRVTFPGMTADTGRGAAKVAAEVRRKLIEPAGPLMDRVREAIGAAEARVSALSQFAQALSAAIPGLTVETPASRDASEGKWSLSAPTYAYGRVYADGSITLDRSASLKGDKALAVLAALAGEA